MWPQVIFLVPFMPNGGRSFVVWIIVRCAKLLLVMTRGWQAAPLAGESIIRGNEVASFGQSGISSKQV